jgi:hypothetical protein
VWMPLAIVMSLEKERGIDLGRHQYRARRREPATNLSGRPGREEHMRWISHHSLASHPKRP